MFSNSYCYASQHFKSPFRKSFLSGYSSTRTFLSTGGSLADRGSNSLMKLADYSVYPEFNYCPLSLQNHNFFLQNKVSLRDFFYQTIRSSTFYFKAGERQQFVAINQNPRECTVMISKSELASNEKK